MRLTRASTRSPGAGRASVTRVFASSSGTRRVTNAARAACSRPASSGCTEPAGSGAGDVPTLRSAVLFIVIASVLHLEFDFLGRQHAAVPGALYVDHPARGVGEELRCRYLDIAVFELRIGRRAHGDAEQGEVGIADGLHSRLQLDAVVAVVIAFQEHRNRLVGGGVRFAAADLHEIAHVDVGQGEAAQIEIAVVLEPGPLLDDDGDAEGLQRTRSAVHGLYDGLDLHDPVGFEFHLGGQQAAAGLSHGIHIHPRPFDDVGGAAALVDGGAVGDYGDPVDLELRGGEDRGDDTLDLGPVVVVRAQVVGDPLDLARRQLTTGSQCGA